MSLPLRGIVFASPQLVSLLDMLQTYARTYAKWVRQLTVLEEVLRNRRRRDGDQVSAIGPDLELDDFLRMLRDIRADALRVDLKSVVKQVDHMGLISAETTLLDTHVMVIELRRRMLDDLAERRFYFVHPEREDYYSNPAYRWHHIWQKFPNTVYDAEEAGKCLALGRHTACVFHLMRVAELGLRALARHLRVTTVRKNKPLDYADWTEILEAIDGRVKALRQTSAGPRREKRLQFYGEIRTDLSAVRDAWRNHVTHAREPYDEFQALSIHLRVQGLMRRLADGMPK